MNDITVNGVTYRQLLNNCGSPKCKKCVNGPSHGPYWYAFGLSYARKYIGKELPAEITAHLALMEKEKDHLRQLKQEIAERADQHRREMQRAEAESAAISALLKGQWADERILKSLGLEKFSVNGKK